MVQLKVTDGFVEVKNVVFQFQMVQLKVMLDFRNQCAASLFQFQMVQLKVITSHQ